MIWVDQVEAGPIPEFSIGWNITPDKLANCRFKFMHGSYTAEGFPAEIEEELSQAAA